jgi:putative PIN family toxin of toxin-antitoxin system
MIDTNILVSAILFPNSKLSLLIWDITERHELILCSHIIEEVHIVFERKFKDKIKYLEEFLSELNYELIYTPKKFDMSKYPSIRDPKDLPILISAINGNVDILVTGDKDFHDIDIDLPDIMTPSDYLTKRSDFS